MSEIYTVRHLNKDIYVKVPGSKSITNRALLLASLASGASVIRGASASRDSESFISCLKLLGIDVSELDDGVITIEGCGGNIPVKEAEINVGSAGTAARFLTAMLAFSDGTYTVRSSAQMEARPMEDLLSALTALGAEFTYLGSEYHFPFVVRGAGRKTRRTDGTLREEKQLRTQMRTININIDKSSQFLSAILMATPMLSYDLTIELTGNRAARSYVDITTKMMSCFGIDVERPGQDSYIVTSGDCVGCSVATGYHSLDYTVEPDISAACYFYAMAAINPGRRALVYGTHLSDITADSTQMGYNYKNATHMGYTLKNTTKVGSIQGDIRFIEVLAAMGCKVIDTDEGIVVEGPAKLSGIDVDMSDFSDQVLTLAAVAPFAGGTVTIRNVAHIRGQESDRLLAAHTELARMGVRSELTDDGIVIYPTNPADIKPADIHTYDDHRVAMSFAVTGTAARGIRIVDPDCCKKTFPDYFAILDDITEEE